MYRQQQFTQVNTQKGQALVLAVGLFALAGIMFFLMFNSGRAVNEKINLVNAADSAAYSGAQIVARNLNFMAYTNRAMIANEVAVGHLFSYEVEMEVLGQVFNEGYNDGGQLGGFVSSVYNQVFPMWPKFLAKFATDLVLELSKIIAGSMIVMYDINNEKYSSFQDQAFLDLVKQNPSGHTLVDETMDAIAQTYQSRKLALSPIKINATETFEHFASLDPAEVDQSVLDAIELAESTNKQICQMILFANPRGQGSGLVTDGARAAYCDGIANGTQSNQAEGTVDNGLLIAAIQSTYQDPDNYTGGIWINDRNIMNYNLQAGGQVFGTADRQGQTTIEFRGDQLNWVAANDTMDIRAGGTYSYSYSSDVASTAQTFTNGMGFVMTTALQYLGLCNNGTITCSELRGATYNSIQRYAALNADQSNAVVTAFLEQNNCSDMIGRDKNGIPRRDWKNNMFTLEEEEEFCSPDKNIYAIGKAEVFYERPDCYEQNPDNCTATNIGFKQPGVNQREKANLFNPFWQVRLVQ